MSEGKIRPLIADGDQAVRDDVAKLAGALVTRAELQRATSALSARIALDIVRLSQRLDQLEKRLEQLDRRIRSLPETPRANG